MFKFDMKKGFAEEHIIGALCKAGVDDVMIREVYRKYDITEHTFPVVV